MKLLLSGARGFIGSYFYNKYSGKFDIEKFSFLNDDLKVLNMDGVDVVVHMSALVHTPKGANYEEYEKVNVAQTLELAKKAKLSGVGQFIFMSTIKVYGEQSELAYNCDTPCNPKDEYAKSKLKAEKELQKLHDENFKVAVIRTPLVYGYGAKANIKNLLKLVKNVSILPLGSINNKRSMVYVGNLTHLIDKIIEQRQDGLFLASDDEAISTTLFIELIAKGMNKKVYLFKLPLFEAALRFIKPQLHKRLYTSLELQSSDTKQKLNLKNPYTTQDGIKFMIDKER